MATQLRELEVDLITRGHLERGIDALRDEFAGTFSRGDDRALHGRVA